MNKSKQITNIIEGFKLGSLGAGSKFVDPEPKKLPEPKEEFKIVPVKPNPDFRSWVGGVKWSEGDLNFFFVCLMSESKTTADFLIYGGRNVKIPNSNMTFKQFPKHPDFVLQKKTYPKDITEAMTHMSNLVNIIKTAGSFSIAYKHSSFFGSEWAVTDRSWYFKDYLKLDD